MKDNSVCHPAFLKYNVCPKYLPPDNMIMHIAKMQKNNKHAITIADFNL